MGVALPSVKSVVDLPRRQYPVKVLQFGSGNFLRGFVDWMIQEANEKVSFNAGVSVIQSISSGAVLQQQEGVYTLALKGIQQEEFVSRRYRIDVIQRIVNAASEFQAFLDEGANPDLQLIVSNTTEAGIVFSEGDQSFRVLASTFPGKLTQLLFHRYQQQIEGGLIVLPTELIEQNGTILRNCVHQYAKHWSLPSEFLSWINTNVTFCNTLVDRIVSGFPNRPAESVYAELGYKDELLVEGEWFHQWVIEGPRWIEEVLPFKKAGCNVIYTNDLAPFRTRKVRILNGAHTCMACVGLLAGIPTVREAIEHHVVGRYLKRLIYDDIAVYIAGDLTELEKYAEEVINRYRNPSIDHQLKSISLNSFSKFAVRVLPTLHAQVDKNGFVSDRLILALASLLYLYRGTIQESSGIKDNADVLKWMKEWWSADTTVQNPEAFCRLVLSKSEWWGTDLTQIPNLVSRCAADLKKIHEKGVLDLLKEPSAD